MTITINLSPELEQQVRETSAARGIPAEDFVVGAVSESIKQAKAAHQLPPHLSPEEGRLLTEINTGFSEDTWKRFHELVARRQEEILTEVERAELLSLTTQMERANVERLKKLIELARLRGVKLEELMDQLGIRDPGYV